MFLYIVFVYFVFVAEVLETHFTCLVLSIFSWSIFHLFCIFHFVFLTFKSIARLLLRNRRTINSFGVWDFGCLFLVGLSREFVCLKGNLQKKRNFDLLWPPKQPYNEIHNYSWLIIILMIDYDDFDFDNIDIKCDHCEINLKYSQQIRYASLLWWPRKCQYMIAMGIIAKLVVFPKWDLLACFSASTVREQKREWCNLDWWQKRSMQFCIWKKLPSMQFAVSIIYARYPNSLCKVCIVSNALCKVYIVCMLSKHTIAKYAQYRTHCAKNAYYA